MTLTESFSVSQLSWPHGVNTELSKRWTSVKERMRKVRYTHVHDETFLKKTAYKTFEPSNCEGRNPPSKFPSIDQLFSSIERKTI